jgi:hypothetical protein
VGIAIPQTSSLQLDHYTQTVKAQLIGSSVHQYRMAIDERAAKELLEGYTLQEAKI